MGCQEILKNVSILYVEDEEDIRNLLADVLKDEFKRFDTARNGEEGLKKFYQGEYDCLITDIEMERMDGLTLAQQVRDKEDSIPIILLTAYSEKERLFRAIDIGVTKYLVKPFTPDKLLEVVCEIFQKEFKKRHIYDLGEGFLYDRDKGELKSKEETVSLTKKEKLFLDLLLKYKDRVVGFDEIEKEVWDGVDFSENALRTLVKRVRKKTYKDLIKNYSGLGYKINLK
ncbi:MAG: DNA-binding response regulator [Epsilonproteobacteria bacterium]|nr:DNA-binding response regulator [Campylobacterota bacterium]NPA63754.1 response regulator transcription factor [Campylobacterota bacterium]